VLDGLAELAWFRTSVVMLVLLVATAYRLGKMILAPNLVDPSDLDVLRVGAEMALEGKNVWVVTLAWWGPPHNTHFFAYPAGMLAMSIFILEASSASGLSFLRIAQLLGMTFDVLVALMVYVILRRESYYSRLLGLTLVIFSPFMYRNSMYKVKPDDAIMLFLILVSFDLFERGRMALSALVFGVSVGFKQFAILLLPYFILAQRSGSKAKIFVLVLAGFLFTSLPGLADPWSYVQASYLVHVYRQSQGFQWGTFAGCAETFVWCVPVSLVIFAAAMFFIYFEFNRADPYTFTFLLGFAFIAFYWVAAEQYFTWFVPFVVVSVIRNLLRADRAMPWTDSGRGRREQTWSLGKCLSS
jgi:hypothetical protein